MARSTRLVILIKNIYTLWGQKRFLLPVTYFPTNLVYPFTLRVTGIINSKMTHTQPRYYLPPMSVLILNIVLPFGVHNIKCTLTILSRYRNNFFFLPYVVAFLLEKIAID